MTFDAPVGFESEDQRYVYPLTADSLVLDCGGFRGDFARGISNRYGCKIVVSEPVFYKDICLSLTPYPNISVVPHAVGSIARNARFGIAGDSTGQFAIRAENCDVHVETITDFMDAAMGAHSKNEVDLLKLNIEGMEFEVLDHLCGTGEIRAVKYLQVQFHGFAPALDNRIEHLVRSIKETHDLEWGREPFLWMSFKRRGGLITTAIRPRDKPSSPVLSHINMHFDAVIWINMSRRQDRANLAVKELDTHNIDAVRIEGCNMRDWGNDGCTWSHRKVLEIIASSKWEKALVLEDDFKCVHDDMQEQFARMMPLVPEDWDLLYLGGHYADAPRKRINQHVIQFNRMKTTSSYAVTRDAARRLFPSVYGVGPVDEVFSTFAEQNNSYIFQPRLMIQRPGYSDLQRAVTSNEGCMQDTNHEDMV